MPARSRLFSWLWLLVLLGAGGFLIWSAQVRVRHVERATAAGQEAVKIDATSPTGYAGGTRELIVPEHNYDSYNWIAQTQLMRARGDWRVRQIDYENAPIGRPVQAASPYRWWLGFAGWLDRLATGRSPGLAIEHAALFADPLLQLLLLVGTTVFVAWRFGGFSAAFVAGGLVAIFPWGGAFQPGAPSDLGLGGAGALWSVLLLLAAVEAKAAPRAARWFFAAGVMGGIGLWLNVTRTTPVLLGLTLGAVAVLALARRTSPLPWRAWGFGIAVTSFAAYLVEYFPAHLGEWHLQSVHPVFSLAWLGVGEGLTQAGVLFAPQKSAGRGRAIFLFVVGLAAIAVLPLVLWKMPNAGFLATDLAAQRLTNLPDGPAAVSLGAWIIREGFTLRVGTTLLPVLLLVPAGWLLVRRKIDSHQWTAVALATGALLIVLGFAGRHLSWWNDVDVVGLGLLVAAVGATAGPDRPALPRWAWAMGVAGVLGLGLVQLAPKTAGAAENAFSQQEVEGMIDRDLAHWLARRAGQPGTVVLATPKQTAALHYYAGLRGLGTLDLENRDGFGAALRIVSATTTEEALELIQRREVRYIILPSWDSAMDQYAILGQGQIEGSFLERLHKWALPDWLRPVAYPMPRIGGFESQSVLVYEVVDIQSPPAALSRIAEYFIEMGQMDQATAVAEALKRYPADLGAQVARLEVELAAGVTPEFEQSMNALVARLARKADRTLPWDQRVALAVVLARGKQMPLAQEQLKRCLAEADAAKLRSLTTGALYRLQVLAKAFNTTLPEPLQAQALELLPAEVRSRL